VSIASPVLFKQITAWFLIRVFILLRKQQFL
jgi:hypothetical protein